MDKIELFEIIKKNIYDVIPELEGKNIEIQDSLSGLGANSIERADIIMMTLEDIKKSMPLHHFAQAPNINGIIEVIYEFK